jgi:hypothetical protein
MVFLLLSFFLMQGLMASEDNLLITSDKSALLFNTLPPELINKIVVFSVNFDIKPVKMLPQEMKRLFTLSQISKWWKRAVDFNKETVRKKFGISPMGYACLIDDFETVALLHDQGISFLFESGKPMPYSYAFHSNSKNVLSFFCALYPRLISDLKPEIKDDVFYFSNSINKPLNVAELSLEYLKHYFYKMIYARKFCKIRILATHYLKLKKNEYFKKDDCVKLFFIEFFFKAFFERSLFYSTYHGNMLLKKPYIFCLDWKNKFFIQACNIDVNTLFNECGITPLIDAIQKKSIPMVGHLINIYGASVNAPDDRQRPPLYHAIIQHEFECIINKLLSSKEINLYWIDPENGNTFFHYLAQSSLVGSKIWQMLLERLEKTDFLLTKNHKGKAYTEIYHIEK